MCGIFSYGTFAWIHPNLDINEAGFPLNNQDSPNFYSILQYQLGQYGRLQEKILSVYEW